MKGSETGRVFNIQRFSVHDGPGIRTVVFLKGCPLRCKWCANPESQNGETEVAWTKSKCIGCGKCKGADWTEIDKICPSKARHTIGYDTTVEQVLSVVDRDGIFYGDEEGGLTISGGEPLMQHKFTYQLLKGAKELGINTAIETTGFAAPEKFIKVAGKLDYLLMDIKTLDNNIHKAVTGVSNEIILDNFTMIRRSFPNLPVHVRTPVIPGVNDNEEAIRNIYDFIGNCHNVRYELLKYHKLGESKYESLGREYPMGDAVLADEVFEKLKKYQFNNISSQLEDEYLMKGAGI